MLSIVLSERLRSIAKFVPSGSRVVDVGTDHALLPIYLIETGRASMAIATDVAKGPCEAATRNVNRHRLASVITVRHGDGLATVHPGEVDTVVIAGMGGHTAADSLRAAPEVVGQVKRIIVQPMNAGQHVRTFFRESGFELKEEVMLVEDGRYYAIVVGQSNGNPSHGEKPLGDDVYAPYRDDEVSFEIALEYGPRLLATPTDVSKTYIARELENYRRIVNAITSSEGNDESAMRAETLRAKMSWLENWLRAHGVDT
jgi:tRNA (adenine22-N1)-methyltransferase